MFPLVRDGRVVAERRVAATRVVPPLDEVEERHPRLRLRGKSAPVEQFAFERREEALAHRIVKAIADATERRTDAGLAAPGAEAQRRVLPGFNRSSQHP